MRSSMGRRGLGIGVDPGPGDRRIHASTEGRRGAISAAVRRRGSERPPGHRAPGGGTGRDDRSRPGRIRPDPRPLEAPCGPGCDGRGHRRPSRPGSRPLPTAPTRSSGRHGGSSRRPRSAGRCLPARGSVRERRNPAGSRRGPPRNPARGRSWGPGRWYTRATGSSVATGRLRTRNRGPTCRWARPAGSDDGGWPASLAGRAGPLAGR